MLGSPPIMEGIRISSLP